MRTSVLLSTLILSSTLVLAQEIAVNDWTVPPYRVSGAAGGLTPMTDISPGVVFVAMQPCRVVDTRGGGVFTGAYGPPIMAANAQRSFDINSAPHCPGIPQAIAAYSLNFTVTQTVGAPGDIRVWPTGNPPAQITSLLNWTVSNATLANATIVPAGTGGSIDVFVAGTATHLLIDVNGYFTGAFNADNQVFIGANFGNQAALYVNNSSGVNGSRAIQGSVGSATGVTWGVLGESNSATGGSAGVRGVATAGGGTAQATYGVQGQNFATADNAAGVQGVAGLSFTITPDFSAAGVRGQASSQGVLGLARGWGVIGWLINSDGTAGPAGALGVGNAPPGLWGVYAYGNIGATGTKAFVDPHPSDPSKEVVYIALEGPEAGTYFRGRGRLQRGTAVIETPEDFRLVTDDVGLSVQITPIGEPAAVAVVSIGLEGIVIRGTRDVEFFYTVNGVRKAFRDHSPIRQNSGYVPLGPTARIPDAYSPEQRRRLIATGIYNEDGTVNMETARRLGWDRIWAQSSQPAARPTER